MPKSEVFAYFTKTATVTWSINKIIPVSIALIFTAAMPAKPLCHTAIHLPLGFAWKKITFTLEDVLSSDKINDLLPVF